MDQTVYDNMSYLISQIHHSLVSGLQKDIDWAWAGLTALQQRSYTRADHHAHFSPSDEAAWKAAIKHVETHLNNKNREQAAIALTALTAILDRNKSTNSNKKKAA